ncbi:hypothetical protein C7C46_16260 [Streptomyces tateyamensis]|uniref:Uncharacterized protein n=1 Tax=Streptomyces tateyamensis TaxID=565073 RepID=A0A2V4N9Y6_9ACTN|nr:hypothetical protein [Streptomyces tateyamensis]PYC78388.1 hypothetical protein C7C46_16260 [Streptomyces tateyamensis]
MASRPNKKRKRPLAPDHRPEPKPYRRGRREQVLSAGARRRCALLAAAAPVLLIGAALLGSNQDIGGYGYVPGIVLLITALVLVLFGGANGWLLIGATFCSIAVLAIPGPLLDAELMVHRGVRVETTVVAVHRSKGKHGPTYSCDLRRDDGVPLAHPALGTNDCYGSNDLGSHKEVMVDPGGWAGLDPADTDYSGLDLGIGALAGATVGYELFVWLAARRGQRRAAAGLD